MCICLYVLYVDTHSCTLGRLSQCLQWYFKQFSLRCSYEAFKLGEQGREFLYVVMIGYDLVFKGLLFLFSENISPEEEYKIACLLMVFVAVSLPTLASNVMSQYSPAIEGKCQQNVCPECFLHYSLGSFLSTSAVNVYFCFLVKKS